MDKVSTAERSRRREYSVEFKASVLEQCRQPGASLAGVALSHGINPNMVHRWMREERQRQIVVDLQRTASAFVPLQLQASAAVGANSVQPKLLTDAGIRLGVVVSDLHGHLGTPSRSFLPVINELPNCV